MQAKKLMSVIVLTFVVCISNPYAVKAGSPLPTTTGGASVKGVVKFAIEKSNTILTEERKRLVQLSDRCSRFPLAAGKTQAALQFIDTTTSLLNSIQVRL